MIALWAIKIKANPVNLNIIQVYATTSEAKYSVIETFYTTLVAAIRDQRNAGYFRRFQGENRLELNRFIIGPYGLSNRNERGEHLIQFAADNGLVIANSLFKHHPRRLYTWTSPSGTFRNQMDYVLIKLRWKTSISDVHTLPGADFGSDHRLVVCALKLKLKPT